jgi:sugar phosphate isomerase/epimerase
MKIAIASYGFHGLLERDQINVFGYLESCRHRYGMRSADIWNGFFPDISMDFLKKVKNALEEREMELANLCVDGPILWEDDAAARDKNHKLALDYLKAAEFLNARTIRIDAGVRAPNFTTEQLDHIVKRYKEYAQFAHDAGFRVGPENHWGAEVDPENMKKICEAVDHPGFGVLVHLKEKDKGERKFAKWAMHSHVSMDIVNGNLEESLMILKDAGYKDYWSVEHHSGKNEYAEVAIQVAKVRDVLLRWESLE